MSNLVIVESPSKAKTIGKYLGAKYEVIASYGHIRDLPSKQGSVKPTDNFEMRYVINDKSEKHVKLITQAFKRAKAIFLATDPDREGESISWHIVEAMKEKKAIKKNQIIKRVTFNSITKDSVIAAIENPKDLNFDLINAQQARRALDYLYGFTLSPILWRKLPGSKSAGRVQSVALRIICERESEIETFVSKEYWDVAFEFLTKNKEKIIAYLTHIDSKKIDKFEWSNEKAVRDAIEGFENKNYKILNFEKKQVKRNPQPPFITSSLQQEAARKLGFSAKYTMQIAQKLYEGVEIKGENIGLITYMRTDSVQISDEAIKDCRNYIFEEFSDKYLPSKARIYKTKSKSAQEAHEAIRPTYINYSPSSIKSELPAEQFKLYELIWNRTVASQMESAILNQVSITVSDEEERIISRSTGSSLEFDGFYKIYREGIDDAKEEEDKILPIVKIGEKLDRKDIKPNQHFTEPAPRFSEASLVKKLEELGIGRPSTYASTISVLQERDYVKIDKKRLIPEERGRVVTAFLSSYFKDYIEYDFTAELETQLDNVSSGELFWKDLLSNFWQKFEENIIQAKNLDPQKVSEAINILLEDHFFPIIDGKRNKSCPTCKEGELSIKFSKYGAFAGCSNYPECKFTKTITDDKDGLLDVAEDSINIIGVNKSTDLNIYLKKGPYGHYLQLGDEINKKKPKRVQIPSFISLDEIDLNLATKLITLPKELGINPATNQPLYLSIGKFGPYILHNKKYTSVSKDKKFLDINLDQALELVNNTSKSKFEPIRTIIFGDDKIEIYDGRYGIYLKHEKKNIPIPKNLNINELNYQQAIQIINIYKEKNK